MMLPRNRSLQLQNRRSPHVPCLDRLPPSGRSCCPAWCLSLGKNCPPHRAAVPNFAQNLQDKKKAELDRQKELAELFAVAIKQPKVPVGKCCSLLVQMLYCLPTSGMV